MERIVEKTVRVAIYARVSTDQEIQLHSLDEQLRGLQTKIAQHSNWKLVDLYADAGVTGTSVRKRKGFLRMIRDCEAGKIDYIITKSISRFARNTVECLSCVRHLQSIGVQLYFEKEGIDTATAVSEMILTVMAAFAQEESRSISENLKWGIRTRFAEGISRWTPTYGYRKNANDKIEIEPTEAAIVRLIFEWYQHGVSVPDILEKLACEKIPSPRGKPKWNKTAVIYLLQNEKYIGDMRLQKWVSIDHISHKSVPNDSGAAPSYYIKNHHSPIIDRHTYQQVQRIMELKCPHNEYSRYPYYDTYFICPLCGEKMIQKVLKSNGYRRIIGCFGENGCEKYAVKAQLVNSALLNAYNDLEVTAPTNPTLEFKKVHPKLDSVQYFWLDDLVERVAFGKDSMTVFWKGGSDSEVKFHAVNAAEPCHVAELYQNYLKRQQRKSAKKRKKRGYSL